MKHTPGQKRLQPVHHYQLKRHLRTREYWTDSSIRFWIKDKTSMIVRIYHMKDPKSCQI